MRGGVCEGGRCEGRTVRGRVVRALVCSLFHSEGLICSYSRVLLFCASVLFVS